MEQALSKPKMSAPGTRKKILSLIEDVEIVSKELLEYLSTPRSQRPEDVDISQLVSLLKQKEAELQETLIIAKEQGELQKKMDMLKVGVDRRDHNIRQLQKNLKEAETLLATAIFQAKHKLESINQANSKKISSEELIKYAHKISASNAVSAPPTWQPGDPRRPYPTDMDMRMGWLGRRGDVTISSPALQSQGSYPDGMRSDHPLGDVGIPAVGSSSGGSSLPWQHSFEIPSSSASGGSGGFTHPMPQTVTMENKPHKEAEDVELMSSDSSSSSSSDE